MGILEVIVTAIFALYIGYVFIYGVFDAYRSDQSGGSTIMKNLKNARRLLAFF